MPGRLARAEGVLGSPARNLAWILGFMGVVVALATAAYCHAGWSFADATYMVALTVYTVGYGEVRPIDTPYLHAVTMATMVLGCTGMILLTSALVQVFTALQLRELVGSGRMEARIGKLDGHVIICGYGRIGVTLARDLSAAGTPLVVLERNPARLAEAETAGHLGQVGDAAEETALLAAGVERARVLATVLPDDAANVFITLTARALNPALQIIARGEAPSTETKLRHAGADQVVLPTHIGAERMARMILYPESAAIRDDATLRRIAGGLGEVGLGLERLTVAARSAAIGITVADAERRGAGTFMVVQIERDGGPVVARPASDERIAEGDRLLLVARDAAVAARLLFGARGEIRVGRNVY